MKTLCITIDCDAGHGSDIPDAFNACFEFLEKHGISQVTWFVNERSCNYTLDFPNLLEKMICLGEIGLHTHFNELWEYDRCIPNDYSLIYSTIRKDKEILEKWLCSKGYRKPIISFRSGNLLTNRVLFKALGQIGFKVDSSIAALFEWNLRELGRRIVLKAPIKLRNSICKRMKACAYPTVRIDKEPYQVGKVLEIPLNIYVGGRYLNVEWLKWRSKHVLKCSNILVVYFHPFDLIESDIKVYHKYISWLLETYRPKLTTLSYHYCPVV